MGATGARVGVGVGLRVGTIRLELRGGVSDFDNDRESPTRSTGT